MVVISAIRILGTIVLKIARGIGVGLRWRTPAAYAMAMVPLALIVQGFQMAALHRTNVATAIRMLRTIVCRIAPVPGVARAMSTNVVFVEGITPRALIVPA